MKKVAIITNFLALYRFGISNMLSCQKSIDYTYYSSKVSYGGIKTIEPRLSLIKPNQGGIKWVFVKNIYVRNYLIWQLGVFRLGISENFTSLILLGNMYCLSTWVNAILGRVTKKHVTMWTHGLLGGDNKLKLFFRLMFYRLAHDLFVYENRSKNLLVDNGFNENHIHIIYNSLNYDLHKKLRENLNDYILTEFKKGVFSNDLPTLIYTGRLIPSKKINQLIEAISLLKVKRIKINCIIVGSGSELEKLKKITTEKNLENIIFYGPCYDEEVLSMLIGMSDLMVSPGNIGLTVVHALSYGTPALSHDNLSNQMPEIEIIEYGRTGLLFKENNIQDLANKIETWINNGKSRNTIRHLCYKKIDSHYNPYYQVSVFNKIIERGIIE